MKKIKVKISIFVICAGIFTPKILNAKFGSNNRPAINKYAASVTNRGVILLNKKVNLKYLKGYDWVNVDYNYGNNRLAIKPVKTPGKSSIFIHRTRRKDKIAIIIKKNMLKNKGANIGQGNYFKCLWDSDKKIIIIDYSKPVLRNKLIEKKSIKVKKGVK